MFNKNGNITFDFLVNQMEVLTEMARPSSGGIASTEYYLEADDISKYKKISEQLANMLRSGKTPSGEPLLDSDGQIANGFGPTNFKDRYFKWMTKILLDFVDYPTKYLKNETEEYNRKIFNTHPLAEKYRKDLKKGWSNFYKNIVNSTNIGTAILVQKSLEDNIDYISPAYNSDKIYRMIIGILLSKSPNILNDDEFLSSVLDQTQLANFMNDKNVRVNPRSTGRRAVERRIEQVGSKIDGDYTDWSEFEDRKEKEYVDHIKQNIPIPREYVLSREQIANKAKEEYIKNKEQIQDQNQKIRQYNKKILKVNLKNHGINFKPSKKLSPTEFVDQYNQYIKDYIATNRYSFLNVQKDKSGEEILWIPSDELKAYTRGKVGVKGNIIDNHGLGKLKQYITIQSLIRDIENDQESFQSNYRSSEYEKENPSLDKDSPNYSDKLVQFQTKYDEIRTKIYPIIVKINIAQRGMDKRKAIDPEIEQKVPDKTQDSDFFTYTLESFMLALDNMIEYKKYIDDVDKQLDRQGLDIDDDKFISYIQDEFPSLPPPVIIKLRDDHNILNDLIIPLKDGYSKLNGINDTTLKKLFPKLISLQPKRVDIINKIISDFQILQSLINIEDESQDYPGYSKKILDNFLTTIDLKKAFAEWYRIMYKKRVYDAEKVNKIITSDISKSNTQEDPTDNLPEDNDFEMADYDFDPFKDEEDEESYVTQYMTEQVRKDSFNKPKGQFVDRGFKKVKNYHQWLMRNL